MKLKNIQKVMGGVLGAAVLLALPACTDDHYDIKPGTESATLTLWQNIEATPELDSLAMILKRVKVYTKEEDTKRSMTYAELLNQAQTFTFWAPLNGKYNAKSYLDQLDQVDALTAEGRTTEANKLEYNVGTQFVQNHMARFNFESNKADQEVRLYNGKLVTYNAGEGVFNGVNFASGQSDKPSSNGMLHVLDGLSPFAHNIYDYLEANSNIFQNVYSIIEEEDSLIFSESASTQGGMNANGEMVYVDSVFYNDNPLLNDSRAEIENEDSFYVAAIPTDAAWQEAYDKISQLFNYGDTYRFDYTSGTSYGQTYRLNADSLKDYNTKYNLITSMYFSPSIFPEKYDRTQVDEIREYALHADSLISTNGVIYYNYASAEGGTNPVFGNVNGTGADKVEPVTASNGIIFPLTSYDMDPSYSFMTKQEVDMAYVNNVGGVENGTQSYINLVQGDNWDESIDISMLEERSYRYFQSSGANMRIFIPIRNLYSGKYRIRIQVLPNRVDNNHKWRDRETGEEVMQNTTFRARLYNDQGSSITRNSEDIVVDDNEVKTYTLWESVEIPKCYVGLPSGVDNCFPLLYITLLRSSNRSYTAGLSVTKIIVEPVHE